MHSREAHIGRRKLPALMHLQMGLQMRFRMRFRMRLQMRFRMRREMHAKHRHPGYQQRWRGPRPKAQAQDAGRISSRHLGPCRLGSVQP